MKRPLCYQGYYNGTASISSTVIEQPSWHVQSHCSVLSNNKLGIYCYCDVNNVCVKYDILINKMFGFVSVSVQKLFFC